jgi:nucleoside-diphosphate-sugar epimerase
MATVLVFGAGGQIGRYLVPRLLERGERVIAVSRESRVSTRAGLEWIRGDLQGHMPELPAHDAIFSLGPLDAFAAWLSRTPAAGCTSVIALSSMSVKSKSVSVDATERALADTLERAEQQLIRSADAAQQRWTLLRPTLIYGAGIDRSLSALARAGMRWRVFPRMPAAYGLRQPVHASDLADAGIAAWTRAAAAGRIFDVGGGERLAYATMLERVRASLPVPCLALPIPFSLVRLGLALARRFPRWRAIPRGALSRLQMDLVAENEAAQTVLGWSPRPFRPEPSTWQVHPPC